jgi:hypothetical protein
VAWPSSGGFYIPRAGVVVTCEKGSIKLDGRCVESGEPPHLFGIEPPRPRLQAVRVVDMSGSNAWAEFASLYRATRTAALDHDRAKTELKAFVPEDAKEASGRGVRAKRSTPSALRRWRRRSGTQRSSESIGALAAAGKARCA